MSGAPLSPAPRTGLPAWTWHAARDGFQLPASHSISRRSPCAVMMCLKPLSAAGAATTNTSAAAACSGLHCHHCHHQHGAPMGATLTSSTSRRQRPSCHLAAASSSTNAGGNTQQAGDQRGCRQQEVQQAPTTQCGNSTAGPAASHAGRLASLSRVLLVNQPGTMFRNLANRKWPSAFGPISLLVFLFGTILALFAAVRSALVRRVKTCRCCKGFGVVRCRLCEGRGTVDWRAKFSYSEMCPLCAAKRFVVCPDCGGHYHRRLFNHARASKGMEAFMPGGGGSAAEGTAAAAGVAQRSARFD